MGSLILEKAVGYNYLEGSISDSYLESIEVPAVGVADQRPLRRRKYDRSLRRIIAITWSLAIAITAPNCDFFVIDQPYRADHIPGQNTPVDPNVDPNAATTTDATGSSSNNAGTYGATQNVAISSTTSGETMCYTNDGTALACNSAKTGCATGTKYTSAVGVNTSQNLKAMACLVGYTDSGVSSAAYVIDTTAPSVSLGNLRNNGVVESAFMIGTAADNNSLNLVEVSLDSGTYATATGTISWKFQLPIGANTWRDGSAHTISVRSKDTAGNVSIVTTINVRKGKNKDVNGDGYNDLAVGANFFSTNAGRAYVFHSTGTGGITATLATGASTIITGDASRRFGYSVGFYTTPWGEVDENYPPGAILVRDMTGGLKNSYHKSQFPKIPYSFRCVCCEF